MTTILERFASLENGVVFTQNNFVLLINPGLFSMFETQHWILFFGGLVGSFLSFRIMMPFMIAILLMLDYKKADKKTYVICILFFVINVLHHLYTSGLRW